jgi:hypothetical protein
MPCEYLLCLHDTFGDGWNGNTVDVWVDGDLIYDDITLGSGSGPECFPIPVETCNWITVIYNQIGGWPYENYYYVYDYSGMMVASAFGSYPDGPGDVDVHAVCPEEVYEYSQPSDLLWEKYVPISEIDVTVCGPVEEGQGWFDPYFEWWNYPDHYYYYRYDYFIPIEEAFFQLEGCIYWLDIKADIQDGDPYEYPWWGWKTSEMHWNDDAVWKYKYYVPELEWGDWELIADYNLPQKGYPETWYYASLGLSAYDGEIVQFAWRYISDDEYACWIDDVDVGTISEGFEWPPEPGLPAGWTQQNVDGGSHQWESDTYKEFNGFQSAACYWDRPNDDWLISPQTTLGTGDSLRFWYLWDDYWDIHFEVYIRVGEWVDVPYYSDWYELYNPMEPYEMVK